MSARARWWWWNVGPAVVWLVFAVAIAAVGEWPAAIISVGAAFAFAVVARGKIYLFQSGFYTGRASMLADLERRRLGLPSTFVPGVQPMPWDPFPPFPAEDEPDGGDPDHTRENMV